MKLTIAVINLQSGVATTKGNWQYALTAWKYWLPHSEWPIRAAGKMLNEEEVDIACITEISEKSLCTNFRSQVEILGQNTEMINQHFFSTKVPFVFLRDEGNAILSKYPIVSFTSHPLHKELFNAFLDEIIIKVEEEKVAVFVAHLALTKKHREIQVKEIIEILKGKAGPIILAGDFNEREPEVLDILLQKTPLAHKCAIQTYPSWKPKYPLDYIFLSKEFSAPNCHVSKNPVFSDHLALVASTTASLVQP